MLTWEQSGTGTLLHAYDGHERDPVCGLEEVRRFVTDAYPRTTYTGSFPVPSELICQTCKAWELAHDLMYQQGRSDERRAIVEWLRSDLDRGLQEWDVDTSLLPFLSDRIEQGAHEVRALRTDRVAGILLPGWTCPGCRSFNGEAKKKIEVCRCCGVGRPA